MPYAIIRSAGKQFRVEPGQLVRMPSIEGETGGTVTFGDVLLHSDGATVKAGAAQLTGARVTGEIVRHGRDNKIVVFKFKRRKRYARKQGHRQDFTEIRIRDITLA